MKNKFRFASLLISIICFMLTACNPFHFHKYDQKVSDDCFLKTPATCQSSSEYYYSCKCGKAGKETYKNLITIPHDYSAQLETESALKNKATCLRGAEYFYSCTMCGNVLRYGSSFFSDTLGEHSYDLEVPDGALIKEEASSTSSAVYYKSCICGKKGDQTFTYGEPLKNYSSSEKQNYRPNSLTISLYDTENSIYGFTFNTALRPLRPVIQIAKGTSLTNYEEYPAHSEKAISNSNGATIEFYVSKIEVPLEDLTTYTYKIIDKYVDVSTPTVTFTTKNLSSNTFSFAHVSDSQSNGNSGSLFGVVLSNLADNVDFAIHTGDVVEDSSKEDEWTNMLNANFNYLSKLPIMAISGNHETTYKNGSNETFKHFNNKITYQPTTLGYYYSFTYGNAKFIMLNTNDLTGNKLKDDQYSWLVNELKTNDKTWTFVALHNPLYSAGSYGSDATNGKNSISLSLRNQLQNLFAEHGVDVVLQGHDHVISRTKPIQNEGMVAKETWQTLGGVQYSIDPNGVIYVMSGPSGEQTRSIFATDAKTYHYTYDSKKCSWSEFKIDGNVLTVSTNYYEGNQVKTYATWGIKKST